MTTIFIELQYVIMHWSYVFLALIHQYTLYLFLPIWIWGYSFDPIFCRVPIFRYVSRYIHFGIRSFRFVRHLDVCLHTSIRWMYGLLPITCRPDHAPCRVSSSRTDYMVMSTVTCVSTTLNERALTEGGSHKDHPPRKICGCKGNGNDYLKITKLSNNENDQHV